MRRSFATLATAGVVVASTAGAPLHAGEERRTEASASFGATITKGNTDTERYNLAADYRTRLDRNRFIGTLELNRGKEDGERDVNNSRVAGRYDRFLHGPWYLNTNASVFQDRKRNLRNRTLVGVGLGYQFFDEEGLTLSVEAGPGYQRDELLDRSSESDTTARWALDYRQYFHDGAIRLFHNHEIIQNTSDSQDWIATTRTGVRVPLRANFTGSVQFNYDYERQPAGEARRFDSATLVTLNYEW